jgi:hypothetical protein
MMLRRVAAAVQIQIQRRTPLLEWLAQKVDSPYDYWKGFGEAFASAALHAGLVQFRFTQE